MFKHIVIIFSLLTLLINNSPSYALPNKWCSNGMNDKNVLPSPKPSFNKCPQNASVEMNLREVEKYYLNGSGQEYLCNLAKNPLFFLAGQTKNQRKEIKNLRKIFLYKQNDVRKSCDKIKKTKFAKKKAEEANQKAKANINKEPKEWCISANKFGRQYPTKKLKQCPQTSYEITSKEAEKIYLSGSGSKYLANIIETGAICKNDKSQYKFIRELLKDKKDLGCDKEKTLAEKKAEEEARIRALAEKLAKEEIARQLKLKQKEEEDAKQEALAKKKAEELAKQKALAEKKAKEEARKKALARKKAKEDAARKKAIAAKKAEEEALKQKVLNEKKAKIKDEAQFIVETLKEYVTTDNNKLDILEVSELLENYNSEKQKGWSDATIKKYEELYGYIQKDEGFIEFSTEKKSKQLADYNEEIRQLREYLSNSQANLKEFITKNLGSKNAKKALKLAKETKQILKDFEISKALSLGNNIATWKAMNGVVEEKKYTFKLLNKKEDKARKKVLEKKQAEEREKTIAAQKAKKDKARKKVKSQRKKDKSLTNVIFENKWQYSKTVKCSSGTYNIYDKKNGGVWVLRGEKQIVPNPQDVKITKIDNNKIKIETITFSNKMLTQLNSGKRFPLLTSTEVITVLTENQISTKKTLKQLNTSRFMNNPRDKVYKTTQEGGRSLSCGLLPGVKKNNKSSSVITPPKKKLKSNDKDFKLRQGYFYKKRYADGSCTNSNKEICLSRDQFKNTCQKVRGMTVFGRKTAALSASPRAYQLWLKSGGYITDPKTTYSNNVCRVNYYVYGVYKGSNRKDLVSAKAYEFVVNKTGTILVHKMSQY